jgi:hypothetical protein
VIPGDADADMQSPLHTRIRHGVTRL